MFAKPIENHVVNRLASVEPRPDTVLAWMPFDQDGPMILIEVVFVHLNGILFFPPPSSHFCYFLSRGKVTMGDE